MFASFFLLVDLLYDHTTYGCFLDGLDTCFLWLLVGWKLDQIVCLGHSANVRDRPKYTFSCDKLFWNSISNFFLVSYLNNICIFCIVIFVCEKLWEKSYFLIKNWFSPTSGPARNYPLVLGCSVGKDFRTATRLTIYNVYQIWL